MSLSVSAVSHRCRVRTGPRPELLEKHVCSFCIRGWVFCCRHTTMNELSSGQKMASPVRSPSWRRAFGPSGGRGSPHPMYSGRLYPRGGLPLRRPGPGSVPPPRTGRLQKPLERLLRLQPKAFAEGMFQMCVPCPLLPVPCLLYETSALRSVFVQARVSLVCFVAPPQKTIPAWRLTQGCGSAKGPTKNGLSSKLY